MRKITQSKTIRVKRFISSIQCGFTEGFEDGIEEIDIEVPANFDENLEDTFYINACGESMLPKIENDDQIFVDRLKTIRKNDIVLAHHNGSLTIKRFVQRNFSHYLVSDNTEYGESKIESNTYLVGRVCQIIKYV